MLGGARSATHAPGSSATAASAATLSSVAHDGPSRYFAPAGAFAAGAPGLRAGVRRASAAIPSRV
jgi:hypothetical protein